MTENAVPSGTPTSVRIDTFSRTDLVSELPSLRAELADSVEQIGFHMFIREMLKFPDASYDLVQRAYELSESTSAWENTLRGVKNLTSGSEDKLCTFLVELYDWAYGWLREQTMLQNVNDLLFVDTHATYLGDSTARRKPDLTGMSAGTTAPGSIPSWKDVLVPWKVKHGRLESERGATSQSETSEISRTGSRPSRSGVPGSSPDGEQNAGQSSYEHSPFEQLMSYCLETVTAQPHRRHTFGILLSNLKLQLVYHCRSFVLISEAFDICDDTLKLAVVVAALRAADLKTLGFDHRFINAQGQTGIRAEDCVVEVKTKRFRINRLLYRTRSLLGRGSTLLSASSLADQSEVALKLNCPPASRELEADLLHRASNIPNIIKVVCSEVWDDTVTGFEPDFVRLLERFELRQFRILALSPVCVPFMSIPDLAEFKRSFVKLVIAHKRLFDIGILHCDISIGNIMYDPVSHESYLIDADLAKSVDNLASPSSDRTGTLPFMATDLLVQRPPPHKYRHDLESFFYVLMWMIDPGRCGWEGIDSIAAMLKEKLYFYGLGSAHEPMIAQLDFFPMFEPLRQTWVHGLYALFCRGRLAAALASHNMGSDFDAETHGGHVTYQNFSGVLQS